ncbi:Protein CBG26144 [Caenorhabditis briggsae]|uniref:Uncharacterized protein n=2 Tax=Caenorhabditis briggsae TaxID=6238 RepID=A0AAE9ITH9_CAEBR|nr:Protein CBG26144 [Caenorhabditis briggsae]ULU04665.1 hypothetical protein L3Y34_017437 [Caenorhabditis briggsae]CAR99578.1 Protein CBG26144 [Caenorhabditis briggsae]
MGRVSNLTILKRKQIEAIHKAKAAKKAERERQAAAAASGDSTENKTPIKGRPKTSVTVEDVKAAKTLQQLSRRQNKKNQSKLDVSASETTTTQQT